MNKTFEQEWLQFVEMTYPNPMPDVVREQLKTMFYSGALCLMTKCNQSPEVGEQAASDVAIFFLLKGQSIKQEQSEQEVLSE